MLTARGRKVDKRLKVHKRSTRLYVNAGMNFPECRSSDLMLNLEACHWNMTTNNDEVTCKQCLVRMS